MRRRTGLDKQVLSWKIVAENLGILKVNVKKINVGGKILNWKIGGKIFGAVQNLNRKTGIRNYSVERMVSVKKLLEAGKLQ